MTNPSRARLIALLIEERAERIAAQHEWRNRGDTEPGWEAECEGSIYCALHELERKKYNDICDAYEAAKAGKDSK